MTGLGRKVLYGCPEELQIFHYNLIPLILFSGVFLSAANSFAGGEVPTKLLVHVISKDAKVIGSSVGGSGKVHDVFAACYKLRVYFDGILFGLITPPDLNPLEDYEFLDSP